jgi:hypothetical protein
MPCPRLPTLLPTTDTSTMCVLSLIRRLVHGLGVLQGFDEAYECHQAMREAEVLMGESTCTTIETYPRARRPRLGWNTAGMLASPTKCKGLVAAGEKQSVIVSSRSQAHTASRTRGRCWT